MRIDTLIESTLRNSQLKRVRIKVDPAQLLMQNFHMVDSYEGYILEEDGEDIKVFMLNLPDEFDPIQTVNRRHVSACKGNSQITSKVLAQLEKEGVLPDNPTYQKIKNTTSSDFIDQFLRELGYDDKKLIEFYKSMSLEPVTEGIASKLKDIGSVVKDIDPLQAVQKTTSGLAKVPGLIVGKDNIIGRVAKFIDPTGSGFMKVDSLLAGASEKYEKSRESNLRKGTPIFFGRLPGFENAGQSDDIEYQISGMVGQEEKKKIPSSIKIENVYPLSVKNRFEVHLDYPTIYNPQKTGMVYLIHKTTGRIAEEYPVKIQDNKNRIVAVYDKERHDKIKKSKPSAGEKLITDIDTDSARQDIIANLVVNKLSAFMNAIKGVSWQPRDAEAIISKRDNIVGNITSIGETTGLAALERAIEELMNDKTVTATTNPTAAINRLLEKLKNSKLLDKDK